MTVSMSKKYKGPYHSYRIIPVNQRKSKNNMKKEVNRTEEK